MQPPNITPVELFAKLSETPRPATTVDFPRKDAEGNPLFQVQIQILNLEETMACSANAERYARSVMKDQIPQEGDLAPEYKNILHTQKAIEMLFKACRHPDDLSRPLFPQKEMIKKLLTDDELAILTKHYLTHQVECGPVVAWMTEPEIDAWISKLKEGGASAQFFLDLLSSEALKTLALSLASRLVSSQTDTTSAGLPLETGETKTDLQDQ